MSDVDDVVERGEPHPVPLPRDPPPPPGWQDPLDGSEALDDLRTPPADLAG